MSNNTGIPSSIWVAILSILASVGIVIYQTYEWLRYGDWIKISVLQLLSFSEELQSWIYYPTEWVGVHKIFELIPLSLALFLIGIAIIANQD